MDLNYNYNCRDAFSVIGEMISLQALYFDLHALNVYDDYGDDNDGFSLFDYQRWVEIHTSKGFTIPIE